VHGHALERRRDAFRDGVLCAQEGHGDFEEGVSGLGRACELDGILRITCGKTTWEINELDTEGNEDAKT
jgi:hypothetical protein